MPIKHAILGLLHYHDMHGYKIKDTIERSFGYVWSINYGQIYPNLKALLNEGLISIAEVNQAGESGPGRRRYAITPNGKAAFRAWVNSNPEKTMILRDSFLMRYIFFGFGETTRAVEMIDDQIQLYQKQLARRRDTYQKRTSVDLYARLISELGMEMNAAFLRWLARVREEIIQTMDSGTEILKRRTIS